MTVTAREAQTGISSHKLRDSAMRQAATPVVCTKIMDVINVTAPLPKYRRGNDTRSSRSLMMLRSFKFGDETGREDRNKGRKEGKETHLTTPTCDRRPSLVVRLQLRRLCGAKMRRWFGAVVEGSYRVTKLMETIISESPCK